MNIQIRRSQGCTEFLLIQDDRMFNFFKQHNNFIERDEVLAKGCNMFVFVPNLRHLGSLFLFILCFLISISSVYGQRSKMEIITHDDRVDMSPYEGIYYYAQNPELAFVLKRQDLGLERISVVNVLGRFMYLSGYRDGGRKDFLAQFNRPSQEKYYLSLYQITISKNTGETLIVERAIPERFLKELAVEYKFSLDDLGYVSGDRLNIIKGFRAYYLSHNEPEPGSRLYRKINIPKEFYEYISDTKLNVKTYKSVKVNEEDTTDYYIGDIDKENLRSGKGIYIAGNSFQNSWCYVGDWTNGLRDGRGAEFVSGSLRYVGEFKNGEKHGLGRGFYHNDKIGSWEEEEYWQYGRLEAIKRNGKFVSMADIQKKLEAAIQPSKSNNSTSSIRKSEGDMVIAALMLLGGAVLLEKTWKSNPTSPAKSQKTQPSYSPPPSSDTRLYLDFVYVTESSQSEQNFSVNFRPVDAQAKRYRSYSFTKTITLKRQIGGSYMSAKEDFYIGKGIWEISLYNGRIVTVTLTGSTHTLRQESNRISLDGRGIY